MESPASPRFDGSQQDTYSTRSPCEIAPNQSFTLTGELPPSARSRLLRLPIVAQSPSPLKLLCISAYDGDAIWLRTIHPHQQAWALRHQIELKIAKKPEAAAFSRAAIHAWLEFYLTGNAEWLIYLTPRVMIHPLAPNPINGELTPGIWALPQPRQGQTYRKWAKWVQRSFGLKVSQNYQYRNGEVWLIDRATAAKWLIYTAEMILPGVPEEYYFNLWLYRAVADQKVQMHDLPLEWNRLGSAAPAPAWFYHCAGTEPGKELERLQMAGLLPLPRPPVTIKPWPEKAMLERLIAVPYHLEADAWKSESLRYALRSIEQYFATDWPLIVYATACPEWLKQEFFQLEPSYPQAGLRAYSMAQKVLWMCDDILFLKQTSEEELRTPVYLPDLVPRLPALLAQENRWQRARGHITGRLYHEEGVDRVLDFSTHTPGIFHREQAWKTFAYFGVWYKFPFELAYHGLLGSEGRPCDDKANFESRDDPTMRWITLDDKWAEGDVILNWMRQKFPNPSKWEKP